MCELEKANKQTPFKKDGTLKKQFKDLPRYPVIYEYEKIFKDNYINVLKKMTLDLTNKIGKQLL